MRLSPFGFHDWGIYYPPLVLLCCSEVAVTHKGFVGLAAAGSIALMLAAFGFQHIGDMAPCKLCIWQRWPHVAAIVIGLGFFLLPVRVLTLLGASAALLTAGFGAYHTGVERRWWEGPASCSAADTSGLTPQELLEQIMTAPLVRCDEVPWDLFGLSMASWNMLASMALAGVWVLAYRSMAQRA